MILADTISLAFRNLGQAKLRTGLTTLGVSIGIASLAGMVSLGVGLQEQTVGRFTKSGMFDSITVMPAQTGRAGLFGRGGGGRRGAQAAARAGQRAADPAETRAAPPAPAAVLNDEAMKTIAALDQVRDVYPNVRALVEVRYDTFSDFTTAIGVPMSARDEGAFRTMSSGAFFSNDTDNACLISLDLAKRLNPRDPKGLVGQDLTLGYARATAAGGSGVAVPGSPFQVQPVEVTYRVAGIVERDPGAGIAALAGLSGLMLPLPKAKAISDEEVTSPQALLRPTGERAGYQSLTVKVKHAQFTQDVEDRIKGMGFSVFSLNDALESAKLVFILLDIVLSLIGSIALAVSSLGIVNTMVMSILERTREIGIMKAIGGSDGDIRRIFLIEASAIGLLGGVAGVALGWLVGRAINFGANIYIVQQGGTKLDLFSLPLWLVASAIGFSVVVSLIAGSYPASRAARLDPIQALRHD